MPKPTRFVLISEVARSRTSWNSKSVIGSKFNSRIFLSMLPLPRRFSFGLARNLLPAIRTDPDVRSITGVGRVITSRAYAFFDDVHLTFVNSLFRDQAVFDEFRNTGLKKYLSNSFGGISKNKAIASASGILIA